MPQKKYPKGYKMSKEQLLSIKEYTDTTPVENVQVFYIVRTKKLDGTDYILRIIALIDNKLYVIGHTINVFFTGTKIQTTISKYNTSIVVTSSTNLHCDIPIMGDITIYNDISPLMQRYLNK